MGVLNPILHVKWMGGKRGRSAVKSINNKRSTSVAIRNGKFLLSIFLLLVIFCWIVPIFSIFSKDVFCLEMALYAVCVSEK